MPFPRRQPELPRNGRIFFRCIAVTCLAVSIFEDIAGQGHPLNFLYAAGVSLVIGGDVTLKILAGLRTLIGPLAAAIATLQRERIENERHVGTELAEIAGDRSAKPAAKPVEQRAA